MINFSRILVVLMCLFQAQYSFADNVVVSVGSKHINADRKHNEVNPGLGYVYDMPESDMDSPPDYITFGAYLNSRRKTSTYVAIGYKLTNRAGLEVGFMTGYDQTILVSVAGVIDFKHARVIIFPPVASMNKPAVVGLQVKFDI